MALADCIGKPQMISYRNESFPPLSLPCLRLIRASHRVISTSLLHALIHSEHLTRLLRPLWSSAYCLDWCFFLGCVTQQRSAAAHSQARSKQKPEHQTWKRMRLLEQRLRLKWATADSGWQVSFQDLIEGCMMEAKHIHDKFLRAEDSGPCYSAKAVRPLLERGNISISLTEK